MVALTHGVDPSNSLVMTPHMHFEALPPFARIGTSSLLREHILKQMRSDFVCVDIRGNIGERLLQLNNGQFEALVIAEAAIIRFGIDLSQSRTYAWRWGAQSGSISYHR